MNKYTYFKDAIEKKYEQKHYQQLRCALSKKDEDNFLHFNAHDPLGLSTHPYVIEKTIDAIMRWGAGSKLSRPLFDHIQAHANLEKRLSNLIGHEQTLLFPTAFSAQETLFSVLAKCRATLFIERSYPIQQIKRHIQNSNAIHQFDAEHFQVLPDGREPKIIIAPSVCPKSGVLIDIRSLLSKAIEADAMLIIDDSYAFGALGPQGLGLAANRSDIDLIIGSFGKKAGSFGAYIATNSLLREYIDHHCPQNPLSPASLGAIDAALDLIPDMDAERRTILSNAQSLRQTLAHLNPVVSRSHIVALKAENAHQLSENLMEENIIAMPTDYPSLTFNLSIHHTREHLNILTNTLQTPVLV